MDLTGTILGMMTIPMVLLNVACLLSGFWLTIHGQWLLVAQGFLGIVFSFLLMPSMVRIGDAFAGRANAAMRAGDTHAAYRLAAIGSSWIVAAIVLWESAVFLFIRETHDSLPAWLWSYGVATAAWTWFAHRADRMTATITALRAYAAQFGYIILLVAVAWSHWPFEIALFPVAIPMLLPLVVGYLLALADRDALRAVQV